MLILVVGFPGTGKTTLSFALGQALKVPVLSKDTVRDRCASLGFNYEVVGDLAYDLLIALARDLLAIGLSVILDSASTRSYRRHQVSTLANDLGVKFYMVQCICPDEKELQRRIVTRDVSLYRVRTWEDFKRVSALYEPFTETQIEVNTLNPLQENVRTILEMLTH